MKKINWKHVLVILSILVLATLLYLYKISDQYMWTDEIFSFHAARMIIEKGKPLYDSGLNYTRSPIFHRILAFSMENFGVDTFGSRILNIPFLLGTGLISFFFVKDITKKNKNSFEISVLALVTYLTTNFSLALARETRMYSMLTFFVTLAVYAFYKALISPPKETKIKIRSFEFRFNIPWGFVFLISFYLSYNTQPISILLGLGIFIYLILTAILKKEKEYFIYILITLIAGLGIVYLQYGNLDLYGIFVNLSPDWATEPPILTYYPITLVRNLPGIFLVSPIIIYSLVKNRKKEDILLLSISIAQIGFLSLQRAQHERYLQYIVPAILILTVISIFRSISSISDDKIRLKEALTAIAILIIGIPQIYLLQKEVKELDTYTKTSLSIHKKMEFNKVFEYLDEKDLNNYLLIADYHSAFTLQEMGYDINYILVKEDRQGILRGDTFDPYFNISYTVYGEDFEQLIEDKPRIVIIRNYDLFEGIEDIVSRYEEFNQPRVYR